MKIKAKIKSPVVEHQQIITTTQRVEIPQEEEVEGKEEKVPVSVETTNIKSVETTTSKTSTTKSTTKKNNTSTTKKKTTSKKTTTVKTTENTIEKGTEFVC